MSDLVPSVVPLSAGLSLQVPKLMAPPGSLTNVLNYEQVDLQGQKRIDGYARYDGSLLSALDDFRVVESAVLDPTYSVSNDLLIQGTNVVAVILGVQGPLLHLAPINDILMPPNSLGRDEYPDPEQHYELLLQYMQILRERTEQLPGAVAGLHWFRDRLYAVAGTVAIPAPSGATPNSTIMDSQGQPVLVLDVVDVDGASYAILDTMNPDRFGGVVVSPVASIFESRTEQQAISEDGGLNPDFGWRFVHLGWSVGFEEGLSLYGGLPALNQNLGSVGSGWSNTSGNNGSPLALTQSINITNTRPQVNGWKNSNTPATYGLSPSNITALDSTYIYADAYMSWDGETRTITVPRDNLIEHSPTATVEVDI